MKVPFVLPVLLLFSFGHFGAVAQSVSTIDVMGGSFELSPFSTTEAAVAVATDKATGRKFNVIKLRSGKMKALMSIEKMKSITPFADDSEMMYSGHTGSTR